MSDHDESELWKQMDEAFQAAVEADKSVAVHAHVGRGELESHMRDAHGILAHGTIRDAGASMVSTSLEAETDAKLRVSHWRAHELGLGHKQ